MPQYSQGSLVKELNAHGFKDTQQRRAVLSVVVASGEYLSPAEVYAKAKVACPRIGLTTVYRTLEILADLGVVRRVHLQQGCHSYALASAGHRHHVICSTCQGTIEFEGCDLSEVVQSAVHQTGFRVEGHWLQLFGTCPACQDNQARETSPGTAGLLGQLES